MKRTWLILGLVMGLGLGLLIGNPDLNRGHAILGPADVLQSCAQEDSVNCYWDADSRGNGEGASFINIAGVTYLENSK